MDAVIQEFEHKTTYWYNHKTSVSINEAHLKPRHSPNQTLLAHHLVIHPAPSWIREHPDFFGNPVKIFSIDEPHGQLEIISKGSVKISTPQPGAFSHANPLSEREGGRENENEMAWEEAREWLAKEASGHANEVGQFLFDSPHLQRSPLFAQFAMPSFSPGRSLREAAADLCRRIHREFRYAPNSTALTTSAEELLIKREGVCQDFTHLMIICLRSIGLAARYVSGYIETKPSSDKEKLQGADASHAWASVYCPHRGWMDFDPTNDLQPADRHITVAWGRDYHDIIPVRGVYWGNATQTVQVAVTVRRKPI